MFGKDASQNATHGSDSDTSASREIKYLFGADLAATTTGSVTTATTTATAAATDAAVEEGIQEAKHEEPANVESEVKQNPEGNHDVTAVDTTPVSEKWEPNNDSIKDTATLLKESSVPEVHVQRSVELEAKKDVESAKETSQQSNVTEAEAKIAYPYEKQSQVQSKGDATTKDEEKHDATRPNLEKTAEVSDHEEDKKQESSTITAAASTVTSTAVSVATTVVTGVTEVASAAVTAVSAAVASSGTEHKTVTDANNHQDKTVTIEETPVIRDIVIAEPEPEASPKVLQQQIKENNSTETNSVVPGITTADTHHQNKSNSISDLKASTSSDSNNDNSDTSCPEVEVHSKSVAEANTDQGDNSSRTNTSDDADGKEKDISGNTEQSATKRAIRKSAVHPSSSRIRPPSINKGHSNATKTSLPDTTKKPAEGSDHKVHPQSRTTRASNSGGSNGSNGATRIARLSAPIKKAAAPADTVTTEQPLQQPPAKKAVTKVSKNLPRVATLTKPPVSSSKAAEQEVKESTNTTQKPKKRLSSTKSFISRLTAPTVASANKKAAATAATTTETEAPTRRTSTLKKKQSLTAKPTSTEAQVPNKVVL